MSLDVVQNFVPVFVLVFFRLAGIMLFAPLLGSSRIPRRLKAMLALVLAMCICPLVRAPLKLPETSWELALGIGGEMAFGIAMGMVLSFVFVAVQWGGEMIGQQMGLNLSEVFDPQFGGSGSLVGDMYFMLTTVVFLGVGGHLELVRGVRESFDALPLLSLGIDQSIFDWLVRLFSASASLAFRIAAPVLVTMLVVDLALGCIGKTIPQLNVMSAGLTIRSLVGMLVLIVSIGSTSEVIREEVVSSLDRMMHGWTSPR
jgi:flagellar biosynthetic protein FliR